MPRVHYGGIDLDPISDFRMTYEQVYDPSQLDLLFSTVHISGTFIVNGQSDVRVLDEPPVSLAAAGGVTLAKQDDIDRRPAGMANPGNPAPNFEDGSRQAGAFADNVNLVTNPYKAPLSTAGYSVNDRIVSNVTVAASTNPVTHALLLERLNRQRGQLIVYEGTGQPNEILLHSPGFAKPCDVTGGPKPKLLDFNYIQGATTYLVAWECETSIPVRRQSTDPLLSNRWTMTHHSRDGGWTDVEVEGVAIFDLGILHQFGAHADSLRPKLFLPIPYGYERKDITVVASEDGASLHYQFVDKQLEINRPITVAFDIVDIETEHQQYVEGGDLLGSAISTFDSAIGRQAQFNWAFGTKEERRRRAMIKRRAKRMKAAARAAAGARGGPPPTPPAAGGP